MKINAIMARYLVGHFLRMFIGVMAGLLAIIYLFEVLELIRLASGKDLGIGMLIKMALYKMPSRAQIIMPFAVLFSAMACFWWLSRRQELTAMRSAGFSAWQFLSPLVVAALAIGLINIAALHPLSASLMISYNKLESQHLGKHQKLITVSDQGLWLKESDPNGEVIIHASTIRLQDWSMKNLMVLFFDENGDHTRRLDAESVTLQTGRWIFSNAVIRDPNLPPENTKTFTLATNLTPSDIQESFSDPETISFWKLPNYIRTLADTGLETTPMEVYYQGLLAQPLLLAAMILLAATVSLRPPRFQRALIMVLSGVGSGFLVFFMSSFLRALGGSHQLPVSLSAWSTSVIVLLGSITWLLNTEDG